MLSAKLIEGFKAPGTKRLEVFDAGLQCFGTRVSPNGRKAWLIRQQGRQRRITIGTYPAISLAEARNLRQEKICEAQLGLFSEEFKASKQTLEEVIPVFIQMHAKPRNRGWRAAERVLSKCGPLNHRPLDEIKRSEVVQVLDTLIASGMTAGTTAHCLLSKH
jgi:hypothetical protein